MTASRTRIPASFIAALQKDFAEHGAEAFAQVRRINPAQYLRLAAVFLRSHRAQDPSSLMDDMSDVDLELAIEILKEDVAKRKATLTGDKCGSAPLSGGDIGTLGNGCRGKFEGQFVDEMALEGD
jgi:hypothetical protein